MEIENDSNILAKELKRLKVAQSLASIGNWELDIIENKLYWSDEIYKLFEIDKNNFEASYEAFLEAIHPDDKELVNSAYINSLNTKQEYTIQHRLLMKDGRIKYVEEKCKSYFDRDGNPIKSIGTVQDISSAVLTKQKLKNSVSLLENYQLAMDESSIVSKTDLSGKITYVNDNFCKITGYEKSEVIGKAHRIVKHPDTKKEVFKDLWSTISSKKIWKGVLQNRGKNGDYWVDIVIMPILDEKNEIVEYLAVRHDITNVIVQKQKLDNIANTDMLTGYGNRYKLNNVIESSLRPALAILNIDGFSQINDFYGHVNGDKIIRELGDVIYALMLDENLELYHLQGDEYVILTKESNRDDFINKIDTYVHKISKKPIELEGKQIFLNITAAVSFENKEKLLATADMALKVAKRNNQSFIVFSEDISLNKEYENNLKWSKKVKKAIDEDNIVPVYQPIVNNENGKWEKYESLVRLKEDDKLISPYFFLEISKKSRQYNNITKIMIEKSFERFKDESAEFSVNLTVDDILNHEISGYIVEMLERYKIGSRVVFELVESESIDNFEEVSSFIDKVKSYGVKLAIDDFGTGYSNFEYLLKLKADYIKIDGSMIKDIDQNEEARLVVSTIVDFAKKIGMKTIAEFVENESILDTIKELGIDYSQGYHFSAPKENF